MKWQACQKAFNEIPGFAEQVHSLLQEAVQNGRESYYYNIMKYIQLLYGEPVARFVHYLTRASLAEVMDYLQKEGCVDRPFISFAVDITRLYKPRLDIFLEDPQDWRTLKYSVTTHHSGKVTVNFTIVKNNGEEAVIVTQPHSALHLCYLMLNAMQLLGDNHGLQKEFLQEVKNEIDNVFMELLMTAQPAEEEAPPTIN